MNGATGNASQGEENTAQYVLSQLRALRAQAQTRNNYVDYQRLLVRYAIERFLFRVGQSPFSDTFILKGAMLMAVYLPEQNRTTRDADFLVHGRFTAQSIQDALAAVCRIECDDGLVFDPGKIAVAAAGKAREYPGYGIIIPAKLGASPCNLKVDIGFGEAVTPPAKRIQYPSLLDFPPPVLRAYPVETIVAEKFEAMVKLGISTSRLKDFYDISELAQVQSFDAEVLCDAIRATFERRKTQLPLETPPALSAVYFENKAKQREWDAFLRQIQSGKKRSLWETCRAIEDFIMPAVLSISANEGLQAVWNRTTWIAKLLAESGAD